MAKKEIPQIVPVTEPEYSLLTEPWLKVVTKNGEVKNYGLYGLFENLDNVSSLLVDVEMEDPAIFRMLLAIMYRALDPVLVDDWKTWWSEGSLPVDRILDYLKEHEDRFWLFHPEHPFMQTMIEPKEGSGGALKGTSSLIPEPVGVDVLSNRTWHSADHLSSDELARRLITAVQYDRSAAHASFKNCLDEKKSKTYATRAYLGQMSTVRLKTGLLKKDLLLALIPLDSGLFVFPESDSWDDDEDDDLTAGIPLWETNGLQLNETGDPSNPPAPSTIEETLVWPSRRIRLFKMDNGTINTLISVGKHSTLTNAQGIESMASFREMQDKKDSPVYLIPWMASPDKAFWRSFTALVAGNGKVPPMTLRWAARLQDADLLSKNYVGSVSVITTRYDSSMSSKVTACLSDGVSLPLSVLESPTDSQKIEDAISIAEDMIYAYRNLVAGESIAEGHEVESARSAAAVHTASAYDKLGEAFYSWVVELPDLGDEAMKKWIDISEDAVRKLARKKLDNAPKRAIMGRTVDSTVYATPVIEARFNGALKKIRSNALGEER